jgi:cyclase
MLNVRVIPCLLLRNGGLVKTIGFESPRYVGDPINAVRIFNDKEVDELVFLDIEATPGNQGPNYDLLADIASEAFMPFAYGGGVTSLEQARRLFSLGIEKVVINTAAVRVPQLIGEVAAAAGNSSVVASIDVRRNWRGQYSVWIGGARQDTRRDPVAWAKQLESEGAGEILLTSINRDGSQSGYDLELIRRVSEAVGIPVVAAGGAGELTHFREAVDHGASAVAAGSMFVFQGKHRAVLITYPPRPDLEVVFA